MMIGYWLFSTDVDKVKPEDLENMKNKDVTDVFVVTRSASGNIFRDKIEKSVQIFHNVGIKVHAWVFCFKNEGKFVNPSTCGESYKQNLVELVGEIAREYNIDGVHLDYIRYSGTGNGNVAWQQDGGLQKAIDNILFVVSGVREVIDGLNSKKGKVKQEILLSAAVMPEGPVNAKLYGQDYGQLANYLDFFVPMTYKGNYKKGSGWVTTAIKYIVCHVKGKPVYSGLTTYFSDWDTRNLTQSELEEDVKGALVGGASGFVLFKWAYGCKTVPVILE